MHGLENDSRIINPELTANTHGTAEDYKGKFSVITDGDYKFHHQFLTCTLPDGKGIDPRAFYRPAGYTLVSDDMTVGDGIEVKGKYTGSIELPFNIKLKKTKAKVNENKHSLSWSKVAGADGYEIYYSKNSVDYIKIDETSDIKYDISKYSEDSCKFKVRAFAGTNNGKVYSDYSDPVLSYSKLIF